MRPPRRTVEQCSRHPGIYGHAQEILVGHLSSNPLFFRVPENHRRQSVERSHKWLRRARMRRCRRAVVRQKASWEFVLRKGHFEASVVAGYRKTRVFRARRKIIFQGFWLGVDQVSRMRNLLEPPPCWAADCKVEMVESAGGTWVRDARSRRSVDSQIHGLGRR